MLREKERVRSDVSHRESRGRFVEPNQGRRRTLNNLISDVGWYGWGTLASILVCIFLFWFRNIHFIRRQPTFCLLSFFASSTIGTLAIRSSPVKNKDEWASSVNTRLYLWPRLSILRWDESYSLVMTLWWERPLSALVSGVKRSGWYQGVRVSGTTVLNVLQSRNKIYQFSPIVCSIKNLFFQF